MLKMPLCMALSPRLSMSSVKKVVVGTVVIYFYRPPLNNNLDLFWVRSSSVSRTLEVDIEAFA